MSAPDRRVLDRDHPELSIRRQCALLGVARSGVYRPPSAANDNDDLLLMRRIDELFTAWPFLGSRRMTAMLRAEAYLINRKRVQRLMCSATIWMRAFAVGTLITERPPHRSTRAAFPHVAPTSGV